MTLGLVIWCQKIAFTSQKPLLLDEDIRRIKLSVFGEELPA